MEFEKSNVAGGVHELVAKELTATGAVGDLSCVPGSKEEVLPEDMVESAEEHPEFKL